MNVIKIVLCLLPFITLCDCRGVLLLSGGRQVNARWRVQPHGPSDIRNYYMSYNIHRSSYGTTFGRNRLDVGTHIYNDNYKNYKDSKENFLTENLYQRHIKNNWNSELRGWSETFDRRWRSTTKAPYFENNMPSENSKLPAAVVIGAAKAFGLKTLLPLNVHVGEPLMYCPDKNLQQAKINLDGKHYSCLGEVLNIECATSTESTTTQASEMTENLEKTETCLNKLAACNENAEKFDANLFCSSGAFSSSLPIVCDSVKDLHDEDSEMVLNCHFGHLPEELTSFIPTTEDPIIETLDDSPPEKNYVYETVSFFVDLFKKSETKTAHKKVSQEPIEIYTFENTTEWLPSALAIDL